jgi:hypothetical protein
VSANEDDISAEEAVQIQSARLSCKNEHSRWQKSACSKKKKRKKGSFRLITKKSEKVA